MGNGSGGDGRTPAAFVVDDDPAIRRMLKRVLERELGHVVTAELASGEEALDRLGYTTPDLIVVDVNMAGMDGLETTRRIKALHPDLPVVAVTGVEDQDVVSEMIAAGASSYVIKGSEPDDLVRGLRAAIEGRGFLDERVTEPTMQELRDLLASERERADALERLAQMKQELISVVTHEFRTPLTILKAAAKLLGQNDALDDAARQHALDAIQSGSDRLSAAVTQLATVSEIRGGELILEKEFFSVKAIADDALSKVRLQGREVTRDLQEAHAIGDRPQLVKVASSLIDNAVKFTEGRIWLETFAEDGRAVLRVRDEGEGIGPETLRRVLEEPLSQGDTSTTRRVDGLGLSLYIGRHILELSGGHLQIESGPHGTTAAMVLPTP